jgi:hypothetical protein
MRERAIIDRGYGDGSTSEARAPASRSPVELIGVGEVMSRYRLQLSGLWVIPDVVYLDG